MSNGLCEQALGGSRAKALEAIKKIAIDMDRLGSSDHKDAREHQMALALNVLGSICRVCEALRERAHYDIYVKIYTEVLVPKMESTASPSRWKRMLPLLQYLLLSLVDYHFVDEACILYTCISINQLKWPDTDDFKYLINIHGCQLQMLCTRKQNEPNEAEKNNQYIAEALTALEILFLNTIQRHRKNPVDCTTLITQFLHRIITKSSNIQLHFATTLQCPQMESMYKAFFELLSVNSKYVSPDDPSLNFQKHLDALFQFVKMDVHSKFQQQVAVQHARILRDMEIFKANEFIGYCSVLLYNLLKIVHVRNRIGNFKVAYTQLSSKFCTFLKKSGKDLMQYDWFQDFFALIFHILIPMQTFANEIFQVFWQQMDKSLYVSHIYFLSELNTLTPLFTNSNLIQFICCKNENNWLHIQMSFLRITLETYTLLLKNDSKEEKTESNSFQSIKTEVATMLKRSINTFISIGIECEKSAVVIKRLCSTFAKFLKELKHCRHTSIIITLSKELARLKDQIVPEDWLVIIRLIFKTVSISEDTTLKDDILSCFIAEMICNTKHTDLMTLHNYVHFHHYGTPGTFLFDIYVESTSAFKPILQKHEKRIFHSIESQYIWKFYDRLKDRSLFTNIAQRCQTKYDFINAVHAGKLIDQSSINTKVQKIYEMLKSNKITRSSWTRMDELTLAHSVILLLFMRLDNEKVEMSSQDFQEGNFSQLLQEKPFISLSAKNEMELIDMALEALHAFKAFFYKADAEPLPPHEGDFLDWMRVLEDLVSLAYYFQVAGYLEHAIETWLLHYRISDTVDDVHSSLRSLAFFCEYNSFFENDERLDLSAEVEKKQKSLTHILKNLSKLLMRQQNFALICLCQIAYYYASQKKFKESSTLLNFVYYLHKYELQREGRYDIIIFTADVVRFRIFWKHLPHAVLFMEENSMLKEFLDDDYCLLHEIDKIIERLRSFVHVSSVDKMPYTILLSNLTYEFAEFAVNRLCDNFLSSLLCCALKICVEGRLAVRTVQLLSKWVLINLQMEFLQKAEIKMQIIECILGLRDTKSLASSLKAAESCPVTASKQLSNEYEYGAVPAGLQEVRKAVVYSTPSLTMEKSYIPSKALDHKLSNLCSNTRDDSHRLSNVILWSRFTLNFLRARFNYLASHSKDLEIFYENSEKWLRQQKNPFYIQAFQSTILIGMIHCGNLFRANKEYEKAINHLRRSIEYCKGLKSEIDIAYLVNFKQQLQATQLEIIENKGRNLPLKKSASTPSVLLAETKIVTSKYRRLPINSCKKPSTTTNFKTLPFSIYSDRKIPRKASASSAMPLGVVKSLTFSQSSNSGSSSDNESPNEHKNTKKESFNTCQIIEVVDSDYEMDVEIPKESKESQKNTTSKDISKQQTKPKLKFLESIELEDLMPSQKQTVETKTDKDTKGNSTKKSKDELKLIEEMQSLKIDSIPALSDSIVPKVIVNSKQKTPPVSPENNRKRRTKKTETSESSLRRSPQINKSKPISTQLVVDSIRNNLNEESQSLSNNYVSPQVEKNNGKKRTKTPVSSLKSSTEKNKNKSVLPDLNENSTMGQLSLIPVPSTERSLDYQTPVNTATTRRLRSRLVSTTRMDQTPVLATTTLTKSLRSRQGNRI